MKCQDSSIGRPGHRDPVQPGNIDSFGLPGSPGEREDVNNHNRLTKMTTFVSLKATFATYVILHVFAYYDYPAVSISVSISFASKLPLLKSRQENSTRHAYSAPVVVG